MKKYLPKLLILLILISLGIYLFIHYDLSVFFTDKEKAINLLKSFGPLSIVIFILLQIAQVIIAPFPGEATGFIGGYVYGPVMGTIYSTIGLTIGSWVAFALSRFFGEPFVEKFVKPSMIAKYDYFLEHKGSLLAFILFLIPGFPKDSLCYVMGLSHMHTIKFMIVSTAGRLLGTIGLSVSGALVCNPHGDNNIYLFIMLGIISVLLILAYIFRDRLIHALKKPPQQ